MLSCKADLSLQAAQTEAADSPRILALDCEAMRHNNQNCWTIELETIGSGASEEKPFVSMLELYEDYLPLGPRHSVEPQWENRPRPCLRMLSCRAFFLFVR
jgi:hypothetical protein